mmetsp:Transcript_7784/g.28664  ORF Transcript_7784/g.28664 Transcript_7784/m.28664 type:complete len:281 (+) Transcript_7784:239-1081(+)
MPELTASPHARNVPSLVTPKRVGSRRALARWCLLGASHECKLSLRFKSNVPKHMFVVLANTTSFTTRTQSTSCFGPKDTLKANVVGAAAANVQSFTTPPLCPVTAPVPSALHATHAPSRAAYVPTHSPSPSSPPNTSHVFMTPSAPRDTKNPSLAHAPDKSITAPSCACNRATTRLPATLITLITPCSSPTASTASPNSCVSRRDSVSGAATALAVLVFAGAFVFLFDVPLTFSFPLPPRPVAAIVFASPYPEDTHAKLVTRPPRCLSSLAFAYCATTLT